MDEKVYERRVVECLIAAQADIGRAVAAQFSGSTPFDGMHSAVKNLDNARYWLARLDALRFPAATERQVSAR